MQTVPLSAVGDITRGVSISYAITNNPLRPEQLAEAEDFFILLMTKQVHAQWIKHDFMEINGTKWFYMECMTPAQDGTIHNIELGTSYRNVLLLVNFNATAALFSLYEGQLRASVTSLKIKGSAQVLDSLPASNQMVSPEEYIRRGYIQLNLGFLPGAEQAFDAALDVDPGQAKAQIGLGRVDADRAQYADAIQHYTEALADDPHLGEAYARRAFVEAENYEMDLATADRARAITEMPTSSFAYRVKAYLEERSGDLDQAIADCNKALSFRPEYSPALIARAWLNMMQGHLVQARQDLQTVSSFPHHDSISMDSAVLSILEGKPDAALLELQAMPSLAIHGAPTEGARFLIWELESEAGQREQADEELSAFLKDDSQLKRFRTKDIGAFLTRQMSEADLLTKANSNNPLQDQVQHCDVWYYIGVQAGLAGDRAKMTKAFQNCLATGQKYMGTYLLARAQLSATKAPKI